MKIKSQLHVIVTDDKDGTNFHAFFTEEERDAKFHDWCAIYWDTEVDGEMPSDPYVAYETISAGSDGNIVHLDDLDFAHHPLFMALRVLLTEVVDTETDSDGDIILPLDRSTDLRAKILSALGKPIQRKDIFVSQRLDRDSEDNPIVWDNEYRCDCGEEWTDSWSCQCDDRCPSCDASTSPHNSTWIGPEGEEAHELWTDSNDEPIPTPEKTKELADA